MSRLIAAGVPVGESARLSHVVHVGPSRAMERLFDGPSEVSRRAMGVPRRDVPGQRLGRRKSTGRSAVAARQVELLTRAAIGLEQSATSGIVVEVLHTFGVVSAWTDILVPALQLRGEQFARTGDGINAEHLLSECIRAGLSAFARRKRRRRRMPVVLLAAPDGEHHVLALQALAAALAEVSRHSVMLGGSVPPRALVDAVAQLRPAATFLWAHRIETAHRPDFTSIPSAAGRTASVVVLGGPGWPHDATERVADLAQALHACTRPTLPSFDLLTGAAGPLVAS